ncbi:MAG TPA: PIG-L family deacetylase [Blastocatellia bacterium]|nr:PIG-L family deacetylase [Blastocatellia bacterium]
MMRRSLLVLTTLLITTRGLVPAASVQEQRRPAQAAASRVRPAPVEPERGIVALDQALRDLTNPRTVMCVAAHPYDADYSTLALYRKRLGVRTVIVFATRGEGRESLHAGLSDEELGVLNTRGALEAARIAGSDVYFLNLRDFGHSRSADEALSMWNREEALAKLVRAIRLFRPDVIITRHTAQAGTGQQQAIARLLLEAYKASADAERFKEADTGPWQVRRIFESSDEASADVTINVGEHDQTRGLTYAEIGRRARSRLPILKDSEPRDANERVHYRLALGPAGEKMEPGSGLLSGIELPEKLAQSLALPRIGNLSITEAINMRGPLAAALTEKLTEKRAEGTAADMQARYGDQFFRMLFFIEALERALALALELSLEVSIADRVLVPGQSLTARLELRNGGEQRLSAAFLVPESLAIRDQTPEMKRIDGLDLKPGSVVVQEISYEVPKEVAFTLPHSAQLYKESYYPVGSSIPGTLTLDPFGVRLLVTAEVRVGITAILIPSAIRFDISSPVEIATAPFLVLKDWETPRETEIAVRMRNRTEGALEGALWVVPLALKQDDYEPVHIKFGREDEETVVRLKLALPIAKPPVSPDILIEFRREKPAPPDPLGSFIIKVETIGVEVPADLNIGYIPGPGDWIPFALSQLGVSHSQLSPAQIRSGEQGSAEFAGRPRRVCGDLSGFQAIIVGDRALSSRSDFLLLNDCLLEYVRRGGNLIFFYQWAGDWNAARERQKLAPFPIRLSSNHITQEDAAVKVLAKDHPLLTGPNAIADKDFSGWVRHRALYLPEEWDSQYTPLLESSDSGQEPQRGGLLVTKYGEGTYTYISYDLGRQLMASNAGAFRLLANLISLRV